MKNGYWVEGSLVVLGGFVVPLVTQQHANATVVYDPAPGTVLPISGILSSGIVSDVLVSGAGNGSGGTVLFLNTSSGNSYTGATVIDGGATLSINRDGALGVNTGTLVLGDATNSGVLDLDFNASGYTNEITGTLVDERGIRINSGGGTIITDSNNVVTVSSGTGTVSALSSYVAEFAGIISGNGLLTVTGGGTLELAGDNVWNGGVLVNDGSTLEVGHQGNLGPDTNLVTLDDGTIAFDQNRTFDDPFALSAGGGTFNMQGHQDTLNGVISGAGTLTVEDYNTSTGITGGVLTLTGDETYTGGTTVEGGMLRLDSGTLVGDVTVTNFTSSTTVISGSGTSAVITSGVGSVGGIGTIGGDLTVSNGGSVTPGIAGSGTLTVDGDFVLNSGTTLNINLGSGGAGQLDVGGNATLDGNLVLKYAGYAKPGTYQYINAGSTTGGFTSATTTDDLVGAGLKSDVESTSVTLTQNSALPTGDLPTLIIATTDVATSDAQLSNRMLLDRLQTVRTTALAQRDEVALSDHHEVRNLSPYGLWVAPLGGFGSGNGGGAPGYTSSRYGLIGGVDGVMAPGWVNGAAIEYSHQHVDQSGGGSADIGTPRIMAYTGFWRGPYAIDLTVGDGSASITTSRSYAATLSNVLYGTTTTSSYAGTATGKRSANELTASLQASGNYLLGYRWALSPAAGVRLARLSTTGVTETGSDYFDYSVAHQHVNSIRPYVDVQAARRFYFSNGAALLPTATVGVEGEVGTRNSSIQAQTAGDDYVWTIQGVKPASINLDVNLGLAYETSKRQSFSVKFMGTESANGSDQTFLGQYGLRF